MTPVRAVIIYSTMYVDYVHRLRALIKNTNIIFQLAAEIINHKNVRI